MQQLGIFAKYWEPGTVKTRLAASIGNHLAAKFHRACLTTLLDNLANTGHRRVLSVWPPERLPLMQPLHAHWEIACQVAGDLGQKMQAYFSHSFAAGADRVVLIGSDCPLLTEVRVNQAFLALDDHDVVLGPATDGGYYLVGGTARMPSLWENVAWSTPTVWPTTVEMLQRSDCQWATLVPDHDIDDAEDLLALHKKLQASRDGDNEWTTLRTTVARCVDALAVDRAESTSDPG